MRKGYAKSIVSMSQSELPLVLGRDCAGEIIQVGSDVWDYRVGDRVWAANAPFSNGTHADYVVMNESEIAKKPRNLSDIEAASVPFAALTAWNAIFSTAKVGSGMRILVNGASGGVGFFAVNLLKNHLNCVVGATSSSGSFEKLKNGGADLLFDYNVDNSESPEWKGQFDLVLNCVDKGEEVQRRCIKALKRGGQYISFNSDLVRTSDSEGVLLGLPKAMLDNRKRSEQIHEQQGIRFDTSLFVPSSKALSSITRLFESKQLVTNIGKVFSLTDIKDAYQYFEDGKSNGKIVFDHSK
ncbi:zinc-containing alcohol dehydrogenase [Heterostelium album PN500]|uniref:Zinc-containing alcohol dehydrogenase n=1 Tax=Heterostelium pallidum (strain ATCC 26659 / Pp 5 / PN500) TaxID=670386 RepID=D3B4R9_HETP5|nr:zinc-containing alcohol dehydrogenase [Heterostelium album PN500]EFA84317.1 zinc-containing alcohol dehydrogenase [Heterostelium album PN500]|eukprot:XP_020436432.1 zinc-containing alcohol dehydrogenase [Heterostelium album PN500]